MSGIGSGDIAPGGCGFAALSRGTATGIGAGSAFGMKSTTTSASTSRRMSVRPAKSYSSCFGRSGSTSMRRGGTRGASSRWLTTGVAAFAGVVFCSASSSMRRSFFGESNAA